MKIELDVTEDLVGDIVISELKSMREFIKEDFWETEDYEKDLAAIDRILSWYSP